MVVDDAKIKEVIENEEDVEKLQMNLNQLYLWKKENKMKFNGSKFQLLRYGHKEDIKNNTIYFRHGGNKRPVSLITRFVSHYVRYCWV